MVVTGAAHPLGPYLSLPEAWQDHTSLPSELGIAMGLSLAKVSRGDMCHFPDSTLFAISSAVLPSDQDGSSHLCCTRNLRKKNIWCCFQQQRDPDCPDS